MYCDVSQEGRSIHGEVAGNYGRDYEVSIAATPQGIVSDCTCPVGDQCKHAVAILLAALEQAGTTDTMYQRWLERSSRDLRHDRQAATRSDGDKVLAVMLQHQHSELAKDAIVVKTGYRRALKSGGFGKVVARSAKELLSAYRDDLVLSDDDRETVLLLEAGFELSQNGPRYAYSGLHRNALQRLAEKQQLYWDESTTALTLSGARHLSWHWQPEGDKKALELRLDGCQRWRLLPFTTPWYVDLDNHQLGPINTSLSPRLLHQLSSLPALTEASAQHFATEILNNVDSDEVVLPSKRADLEINAPLAVQLHLWRSSDDIIAALSFGYGAMVLSPRVLAKPTLQLYQHAPDSVWVRRDFAAEQTAFALLADQMLEVLPESDNQVSLLLRSPLPNQRLFWQHFLTQHRQQLSQQGWQISTADDLHLEPVAIESMQLELQQQGNWFDLDILAQLSVDGMPISLAPLLLRWLAGNPDWREPRAQVLLERNDGPPLLVDYHSLQPILAVLAELGDRKPRAKVRLARHQLARLPAADEQLPWLGDDSLKQLAAELRDFSGIEAVAPPQGLRAELRGYQQQGLNWLSFLHRFGFGGVLADDMGLGKTLQTLAHLQRLKEQGQLSQPALLICPTSLVGNWRSEAKRFLPDLKVLVIHGARRQEDFEQIEQADLVITTYPLIHRDIDTMVMHDFSVLVLDEAQAIKNPAGKATRAIKDLVAEQRLALTGTPMENHLGELWSLYDFILPGFLGTQGQFSRLYRRPIEQFGDQQMQQWLQQKIRPFMLRRTKDQVVTELPPKTEIIQRISLPTMQRTLYETVRASMESKVRQLLAEKGVAASRIEFLDALLKLRQICCDPKLTGLEAAQQLDESAKLEYLLEKLPQMIADGRRVLLFSQFTSMLARIEARVQQLGIGYSLLTGQTKDRDGAVAAFQSGQVPLFLVSLKAGGVGLNLTQADTVIHFDPWWNPAAEQQATDRAYRIGQDKPVFVYKLICEHTVEERVLALQQSKQALADSVYGQQVELGTLDDAEQLLALLAK